MMKHGKRFMIFATAWVLLGTPLLCHGFDFQPKGDGPPPVPPFIAEQYDSNGDNMLSPDEMDAAYTAFMERFDTDGDGELSMSEQRAVHEAEHQAFLSKYDTDGDGEISPEERDAADADFIARFDTDGDGTLSAEELKSAGPPGRERPRRGCGRYPAEVPQE